MGHSGVIKGMTSLRLSGNDLQSARLSGHNQRRCDRLFSLTEGTPERTARGNHVLQREEYYVAFFGETRLRVRG